MGVFGFITALNHIYVCFYTDMQLEYYERLRIVDLPTDSHPATWRGRKPGEVGRQMPDDGTTIIYSKI
jgi:hypothetical protein